MTSKAERKRQKQAARKRRAPPAANVEAILDSAFRAPMATPVPETVEFERPPWMLTEKQEAAWSWFRGLRRAAAAGADDARDLLSAAREQISDDEYAVLCELIGDNGGVSIAYRVGRSRTSVRALEMSGLRKLVIHRFAIGLDDLSCSRD